VVGSGVELKGFTIQHLPASERPRERLQERGAGALSVQELIAVILGAGAGESVTETVKRLVDHFGDLRGISVASVEELVQVKGIGPAYASRIRATFELAHRLASCPEGEKPVLRTPEEARDQVAGKLRGERKEHFLALLLDTRGRVIKTTEVSVGSLDASIVHPREVFSAAMAASAASVVFVHNHPSGDPEPSIEDVQMTKRLVDVGELVGIGVVDHIVVAGDRFVSLKRRGLF
jgi:DNA repair protein RadC